MKTLKDFLEVYKPKSPDEQKFVDKHVTIKHKDRNGNGDDVFKATNIKTVERKKERHGYDVGEDEKVYEETEKLDELSQKMVRAYRDKARDDKENAEDEREYYKAHDDNTDDEDKKIRKRTAGIKTATKKIYGGAKVPVKEDVNLDDLLDEALDLLNSIDEKTLTPAEMKKREEVVKAIKRDDPKMDKSMAYAIATKTAKRVAEEAEELDEDIGAQINELIRKKNATASPIARKNIEAQIAKLKRQKSKMNEEAEELDEISAKKLTDYTAKASDARGHRGMSAAKLDKRYGGVALAHEKIRMRHAKVPATEGYVPTADEPTDADKKTAQKVRDLLAKEKKPVKEEALDELSHDTLRSYRMKAKSIADHGGEQRTKGRELASRKSYGGRMAGVEKAKVMAKEEIEQIDELSKKTLGSYVKKASNQVLGKGIAGGMSLARNNAEGEAEGHKLVSKAVKRMTGIQKAAGKLTKEDIINRSIEKYVPEEIKFTPEERLLKRLEGLSEAHVNTLLGLFEALNSDNQNKMIETVDTREGVNQLLNFALENRGE
jgi:hypothetical protein